MKHENNRSAPHGFVRTGFFVVILVLAGDAHADDVEIEKLKQGLQSPHETARIEAIKKLKIPATEAGKAAEVLVPLLADKSAQVQQAASVALVKFGKGAVPALALALQDRK